MEESIQNQKFVYAGVEFCPADFPNGPMLRAVHNERTDREYKGYGKLMVKSKCITKDDLKRYEHQIPELEMQIAAFLNTNGGLIFLGVGDNGAVKGGDYTYKDQDNLLSFLKNYTIRHPCITGKGLIQDPEFVEIPAKFVKIFPNAPDSKRYLVIIKIKPSEVPVYNNGVLYMRELGGVVGVDYATWQERHNVKPASTEMVKKRTHSDMHIKQPPVIETVKKLTCPVMRMVSKSFSYADAASR